MMRTKKGDVSRMDTMIFEIIRSKIKNSSSGKGVLIDLEGVSRKTVREECIKLFQSIDSEACGHPSVSTIAFPWDDFPNSLIARYEEPDSILSKGIGNNVYGATALYRIDRYTSYIEEWKEAYNAGGIIITEHYTPESILRFGSNMSADDLHAYISWLQEEEYCKLGLPAPDVILFFDTSGASEMEGTRRVRLHLAKSLGWIVVSAEN